MTAATHPAMRSRLRALVGKASRRRLLAYDPASSRGLPGHNTASRRALLACATPSRRALLACAGSSALLALSSALASAQIVREPAPLPAAEDLRASCMAPNWDMALEVKAFQSTAENLPASRSSLELPPLELGRLYVLRLSPETEVRYLQNTAKKSLVQNPLGGLAQFNVPSSGNYRITVDSPLWIDVVAAGAVLAPSAFNGWHSCRLFRKTVQYALQTGQAYVLQLSEATPELVRVVIEAAP